MLTHRLPTKSCTGYLVVLLVFVIGLVGSVAASANVTHALAGDDVQLVFDLRAGTVQHWRLLHLANGKDETHDLAQPAGQMFALKGVLGGVSLESWERAAGGWALATHRPDAVTLKLAHPDQPFVIEKSWRLLRYPWRVAFQLVLQSKGLQPHAQDELWLEIGPGIGEVPADGLGIAQDIYSFTEVVYRDAETITRLRLEGEDEVPRITKLDDTVLDWIGLQSRYFAFVLSPVNDAARMLSWEAGVPDMAHWYPTRVNFKTSVRCLLPIPQAENSPVQLNWDVFGGGKSYDALTAGAPDIGGLLFSGLWDWMRMLTLGIMHVLNVIHVIVGSWGIAIILLAVLVRLLMYPVARNAMRAQKAFVELQEKIQPELDAIRKQYKGGEQSERILQLYERHHTSPFSGLKPLLIVVIQIPIFVALYHLLGQVFELRSASFLWIPTLAEPDRLFSFGVVIPFFGAYFNILPVLMAITTLLSIKLSPAPAPNPRAILRQNAMLALMTVGFFLLFYSFPSGMVLYWTMANLLHLLHGMLIQR